jgi:hypothetical protein
LQIALAMSQPVSWSAFAIASIFVVATACTPSAHSPAGGENDTTNVPPSGLYRAQPTTLSDTCAVPDSFASSGAVERRFFVTTSARGSSVRANLPLSFDGLQWEELASRATIDFGKSMTLVDAPAPRCPGARRRRDIRASASHATGFDITVAETWSLPEGEDCELPDAAPHISCSRVRRIAMRVEKECASPRELVLLQCDGPR